MNVMRLIGLAAATSVSVIAISGVGAAAASAAPMAPAPDASQAAQTVESPASNHEQMFWIYNDSSRGLTLDIGGPDGRTKGIDLPAHVGYAGIEGNKPGVYGFGALADIYGTQMVTGQFERTADGVWHDLDKWYSPGFKYNFSSDEWGTTVHITNK